MAEMRFMRRTAGYMRMDHIRNFDIMKELQIELITEYLQKYRQNWRSHVIRMPRSRIPCKRSLGRPFKRWQETDTSLPPPYSSFPPDLHDNNKQSDEKPKPAPRSKLSPDGGPGKPPGGFMDLPELPSVPTDSFPPPDEPVGPGNSNDDIDFDDLTRRFEDLKKKK
ncbi:hypothetical protein ANN_16903 [Periplaneta americana]|uniref:Uncharacterized protein n=1 Tax=Periplaneta americana TaxID=6978 RepID=A0ABQ8SSR6_PERAM|nr:hypothetical protein ANN_16903 [Periplaneta americana]